MSDQWLVNPARKRTARSRFASGRLGFTLIEIMIVVAIMGLMAAMGVPSLLQMYRKEGMRKALSDVQDVCTEARARAILQNETVSVIFYPAKKSFAVEGGRTTSSDRIASSVLPDGVDIAMLDINLEDYSASDWARVFFYPDGTSDEMTIVLHSSDDWRKISLEFATALTTISDVDK